MSATSAAAKFANLHDYQGQSKERKPQSGVVEADSSSSVPNNSINSIDHTAYYIAKHDSPVHSSTSGEIYDRRRMLRSIHSSKRPTPTTKYRLSVKPSSFPVVPLKLLEKRPLYVSSQFYQGRTPQQEQIDDLQEELYGVKRNYTAALKENVILKTSLKRSNNEVVKKDRQLQNLLFIQSKGCAFDGQRGNMLAMKQKIVMLKSLLKEKTSEISRLKHDLEAMKISNHQEYIESECNQLKRYLTYITPPISKMQADTRRLPKRQKTVPESNNDRKLKKTVSLLEKENDKMRSKLQIFFNSSNCSPDGKLGTQI
ncbi:hypothetical protein WUBG_08849 [Wuchereria bancrofti]|uniref:Lebercilin domain-containing protein n=1 Tax=Wuchereria bancrofti TaxID=6293 RepID=J9ECR4_WUCBA|nr:hypothetical protein WUBG_08849 [Wuchereria bancrofti]